MKESMKLYVKAMRYYNKGNLKKAMEFCERSISLSLKNAGAINLKGLLFYLTGELSEARNLWKLNSDMNKDSVAQKYLESSKEDEKRLKAYEEALLYIEAFEIKEAIELLDICSESDFNCVNVLNFKTGCFIRSGEYAEASECVDKVLSIDNSNKEAQNNRKLLEEFGAVKRKPKKAVLGVSALVFIVVISAVFFNFINNRKKLSTLERPKMQKQEAKPVEKTLKPQNQEVKPVEKSSAPTEETVKTSQIEVFPSAEINESIQQKNYNKLYELIALWDTKVTNANEKNLINTAKQYMKDEGVAYYYKSGRSFLTNKDYDKALDSFKKAEEFGGESYLLSHIKYMTGAAYKGKNDIDSALKYYKEYLVEYPSGDYEEAVLYELSVMLKDIDRASSRSYALELVKRYPESDYNNTIIKTIINSNQ